MPALPPCLCRRWVQLRCAALQLERARRHPFAQSRTHARTHTRQDKPLPKFPGRNRRAEPLRSFALSLAPALPSTAAPPKSSRLCSSAFFSLHFAWKQSARKCATDAAEQAPPHPSTHFRPTRDRENAAEVSKDGGPGGGAQEAHGSLGGGLRRPLQGGLRALGEDSPPEGGAPRRVPNVEVEKPLRVHGALDPHRDVGCLQCVAVARDAARPPRVPHAAFLPADLHFYRVLHSGHSRHHPDGTRQRRLGISHPPHACDLVLLVHAVHAPVRGGRGADALRGGEQRDAPPAASPEAGGRHLGARLQRQQGAQRVDLCGGPPGHAVLPHLVHRLQLLQAGQLRLLPHNSDDYERHDAGLLLAPDPLRLPPAGRRQRSPGRQRHACLQELPRQLRDSENGLPVCLLPAAFKDRNV